MPRFPEEVATNNWYTEWTISGRVAKSQYVLVVDKEDPFIITLSKIDSMYVKSDDKDQKVGAITVPENKFGYVGMILTPEIESFYTLEEMRVSTAYINPSIAIFFSVPKPIDSEFIKQHDVDEDMVITTGHIFNRRPSVDEEGFNVYDQSFDIYEEAPEDMNEEEDEIIEADDFEAVKAYAEDAPEKELLARIKNLIKTFDINQLRDLLINLIEDLSMNADDQEALDNIKFYTEEELKGYIKVFVDRDPRNVFPWVWIELVADYFCPSCYEPIEKDVNKCPNCKLEFMH